MEQSQPRSGRGRGRGPRFSSQQEPPPPSITTTALPTTEDTSSSVSSETINNQLAERLITSTTISSNKPRVRASKPDELGKFPRQGLVYRYDIRIRNKRGEILQRARRRALYASWLYKLCQEHPNIDRRKIIFDGQTAIFTYQQQLPGIGVKEIETTIPLLNGGSRLEDHLLFIKQAGQPTNLDVLQFLRNFYASKNNSEESKNSLVYIRQMLALVLREYCSTTADFIYNRTFFKQPFSNQTEGNWDLGEGKAAWRGFYSCLVFTNGNQQLCMNLDVSHGLFMQKQPFLGFLGEVMRHRSFCRGTADRNRVNINDVVKCLERNTKGVCHAAEKEFLLKHCKQLRVTWQSYNRWLTCEIADLGESAVEQTFEWKAKNNRVITVAQYYLEQHRSPLQYPTFPVLKMRGGLVVPMEVVDVEPVKIRKITDHQRAKLSRCTTLDPPAHRKTIDKVSENLNQICFQENSTATAWNFTLSTDMHRLPARVLPMPNNIYTREAHAIQSEYGEIYSSGNRGMGFYKPTAFPPVWGMINLAVLLNRQSCEAFYDALADVAARKGIKCTPPEIYEEYNTESDSIAGILAKLKSTMTKNHDCTFLIVILPENVNEGERIYGEVKKLCELESGLGIVTQMVKATSIQKKARGFNQCPTATLENIVLKINAKLDGVNSVLKVPPTIERFFSHGHRIMYVGVDLCHPPAGSTDPRSIAAVVASADDVPNRYFKEIYIQNRSKSESENKTKIRVAHVVRMKEIMKSLIKQYKEHHNEPPGAIVIYRDGISDGEFDTVLEEELMATRNACVELSSSYQPRLTYIVVTKKHHTRFFSPNSTKNIEVGTVVDSHDVTNPTTYNFFLKSHNYPLGTSRPIHYHVLSDDSDLKPDEVQLLTYALCFTYARTTCSISVPAPVKYANLLTHRAKYYLPEHGPSEAQNARASSNVARAVEQTDFDMRIRLSPRLNSTAPFFV